MSHIFGQIIIYCYSILCQKRVVRVMASPQSSLVFLIGLVVGFIISSMFMNYGDVFTVQVKVNNAR